MLVEPNDELLAELTEEFVDELLADSVELVDAEFCAAFGARFDV